MGWVGTVSGAVESAMGEEGEGGGGMDGGVEGVGVNIYGEQTRDWMLHDFCVVDGLGTGRLGLATKMIGDRLRSTSRPSHSCHCQ